MRRWLARAIGGMFLVLTAVSLGFGSAPAPAGATSSSHTPSPPSVDSSAGTLFVGKPHFAKVLASGWPKPVLSESGALPQGVVFTPMNGFATFSGTPAPGTGNDYNVMITATNSQGTDTEPYDLTVQQNPVFPSGFCPQPVTVGQYVHDSELVTAWPPFFGLGASNLPDGLTFTQDDNNEDLGVLSGIPQPDAAGRINVQYSSDANDATRNYRCLLTVNESPVFTDTGMGTVVTGTKVTAGKTDPLAAAGTTGYPKTLTLTESGALPTGMETRTQPGRKTFGEEFYGKPAADTAGDYLLNVTADNGAGPATSEEYVLVVTPPGATPQATTLALSGPSSTSYGTAATYTATVTGGSSPSGYVEFDIEGSNAPVTVPLSDGEASFTAPASLDVNNYTIDATYTGDPDNASSTASADLTVNPVPTSLTLSGPTSTSIGTPATFTATVTSPEGVPQGLVDFNLNGNDTFVDVDDTGTATFTTDPTLTGDGSPYEVDATFSSYSDAPGDWSPSDTESADYSIGPVNLSVGIGDGNAADGTTTVNNGDTVTVDPTQTTEISAQLTQGIAADGLPPGPVTLDIAGAEDYTTQLNLTGEEDTPASDPETGQSDYFWTIAPNTLTGLDQDDATVTISTPGGNNFSSASMSFTLQW